MSLRNELDEMMQRAIESSPPEFDATVPEHPGGEREALLLVMRMQAVQRLAILRLAEELEKHAPS